MKQKSEVTILGSGSSMGVPVIGCHCEVCSSKDVHNHRLRPSILLDVGDKRILVDASPDYRSQALRYQIDHLDGAIITHMHYDHIAGIDELRIYNYRGQPSLPVLMHRKAYDNFAVKYHYLVKKQSHPNTSRTAQLEFRVIEDDRGEFEFFGYQFKCFTYEQAHMPVMGFRMGEFAYVTDIKEYPESLMGDLQGVKVLIVSALRHEVSPVHFNIEEACRFAKEVSAENTYLIHMGHEIEYQKVEASLPRGVHLCYDGLRIPI